VLEGNERPLPRTSAPLSTSVEFVVDGALDAASAARLRQQVGEALDAGVGQVVLNLAGCPYADAASVGILLDVHRRVWRAGGRFALRAPSTRVLRLFRLSQLDHVFTIVPVAPDNPAAASESAQQ
jgi:anti-anti-sigma factor